MDPYQKNPTATAHMEPPPPYFGEQKPPPPGFNSVPYATATSTTVITSGPMPNPPGSKWHPS